MQRFLALSFLLLACLSVSAASGGPDGFGYTWKDSQEPDGPVFNWIDITTLPDAVQNANLGDENSIGPVPFGFSFHYYWIDYDRIKIGSNGWLSFQNIPALPHCFQQMPTPGIGENSIVAPFMSDLNFNSSYPTLPNQGELWHWSNQVDTFIITYKNVPWWRDDQVGANPPDWIGSNTFQIIFAGTDSSITFQYLDLSQPDMVYYPSCPSDMVVGIEDPIGDNGLQVYLENLPDDSLALKFYFPDQDTFLIKDVGVVSSLNPKSKAQFHFTQTPIPLPTTLGNLGNDDFTLPFNVECRVETRTFQLEWQDSDTISSIPLGADTTLNFTNQNGILDTGQYYFETVFFNQEDLNPSNNRKVSELVLLENGAERHTLGYCTGFNPDQVLSWLISFTADFGGGIYVEPPFSPYSIESVDAYIIGNDENPATPLLAGFKIAIHLPDSMGMPGQIVASKLVSASDGIEDDWNTIVFDQPINLDSTGFYISWIQGGNGIGLGSESIGPKSRQSFEIISGNWGPYRFAESEDLLLRARVRDLVVTQDNPIPPPQLSATLGPNPGQDVFSIFFETQSTDRALVTLSDVRGNVLFSRALGSLGPGKHTFKHQLELPSGIYYITLEAGGLKKTFDWSVIR